MCVACGFRVCFERCRSRVGRLRLSAKGSPVLILMACIRFIGKGTANIFANVTHTHDTTLARYMVVEAFAGLPQVPMFNAECTVDIYIYVYI